MAVRSRRPAGGEPGYSSPATPGPDESDSGVDLLSATTTGETDSLDGGATTYAPVNGSFIMVEVVIANNGTAPASLALNDFTLTDSTGTTFAPDFGNASTTVQETEQIEPGATETLTLYVDAAPGTQITQVTYTDSLSGDASTVSIEVG